MTKLVKENKKEIKLDKRTQILQMAEKMFMSQGFLVSMDALAEAVPVSKRTLYNHFADKKSLFIAVMHSRCQFLCEKLEQTMKYGKSVEETLQNLGVEFLNKVLQPESVNIYRTAINEAIQFPDMGKLFFESGPKFAVSIVAKYFEQMNAEGKLKVAKPELAARIFMGMMSNRIQMEFMLGLRKNITAEEKREIVDEAVKIFLKGVSA